MHKIAFEKLFEQSLRRKAKNFLESGTPAATLTKSILITAAIGGVIAVGVMAPNLFHVLRIDSRERGKRLNREGFKRVRRSCYQLQQSGFMESCLDKKGETTLRLTEKGKRLLERLFGVRKRQNKKPRHIKSPACWDRKWRFIMFDIPTDFNASRDALRRELHLFGFYQFQHSVFVHPFPCVKEIKELVRRLNIQRFVEVCTVEDFSNKYVLKFFEPLLKDYGKERQINQ